MLIHLIAVVSLLAGGPTPSFEVGRAEAARQLRAADADADADAADLPRPVVILDGFLDPGYGSAAWRGQLLAAGVDDAQIGRVSFFPARDFADCRQQTVEAVRARFGDRAVDLVGISMGGLVAVDVAASGELEVARVFTVCSPLRGARLAVEAPQVLTLQKQMRPDAAFVAAVPGKLAALDGRRVGRVHYAAEVDRTVRVEEAAPPGESAYWLPAGGRPWSHNDAVIDPRIVLDVLRRLRGRPPVTPAAPPPLPGGAAVDGAAEMNRPNFQPVGGDGGGDGSDGLTGGGAGE